MFLIMKKKRTYLQTIQMTFFESVFIKAQEKLDKSIEKMQKDDKLEVLRYLQKKGIFLVKGNIDKIAKKLNISRYTVYNYLSGIKPENYIKLIQIII